MGARKNKRRDTKWVRYHREACRSIIELRGYFFESSSENRHEFRNHFRYAEFFVSHQIHSLYLTMNLVPADLQDVISTGE